MNANTQFDYRILIQWKQLLFPDTNATFIQPISSPPIFLEEEYTTMACARARLCVHACVRVCVYVCVCVCACV